MKNQRLIYLSRHLPQTNAAFGKRIQRRPQSLGFNGRVADGPGESAFLKFPAREVDQRPISSKPPESHIPRATKRHICHRYPGAEVQSFAVNGGILKVHLMDHQVGVGFWRGLKLLTKFGTPTVAIIAIVQPARSAG